MASIPSALHSKILRKIIETRFVDTIADMPSGKAALAVTKYPKIIKSQNGLPATKHTLA